MGYIIQGILSFASTFLALFVLIFAVSFLKRTQHHKNRYPWIFLLFGVIIFFVMQVLKVFEMLGHVNLGDYTFYMDSMFIAIILFTFIFQYNLILNSELIQIKRKHETSVYSVKPQKPNKKSKK